MSTFQSTTRNSTRKHELGKRILWTLALVCCYCVARVVSISFVDESTMGLDSVDTQTVLLSMVSGDRGRYSVMALGVMPYMFGMIIVMFWSALFSQDTRRRITPRKTQRVTLILAFIISIGMGVSRASELIYQDVGLSLTSMQALAALEMIAGAMALAAAIEFNKKHGIGQMTPIILVNMVDTFLTSISGQSASNLFYPGLISAVAVAITLVMENVVVKMPVQRVSIHNNYAESNYIGFKLNPIGVMPVMFSTLLFMVPQLLVLLLLTIAPGNDVLMFLNNNLVYTSRFGVMVYLAIILVTAIAFSFMFLSPADMAENLQKGGDSIVGVYAGRATVRYLRLRLLVLSVISGFIMAVLMALSFSLALRGTVSVGLAMLPSSAMMLAGFACMLGQEIVAYGKFDAYKAFL